MRQAKTFVAHFAYRQVGGIGPGEQWKKISATSLTAARKFARHMVGRVENCDRLVQVYLEKDDEHEQETGWDSVRRGIDAEVGQG